MVDKLDEKAKERERLRQRADKLNKELDELEESYKESAGVFRNVIAALCEMGRFKLNPESTQALDDLQVAVKSAKFDPTQVNGALVTFRTALLASPMQTQKTQSSDHAGRDVALGILTGLHLHEPEFDGYLESAMADVSNYIKGCKVKPAIALVEDLLARYREAMDRRRQKAIIAMKEVLAELMQTEDELTEAFQVAATRLSEEGERHEANVNASMGSLAKKLGVADNLEHLKSSVLDHIRYLRNEIKNKRHSERQLLSSTQEELYRLKATLGATRVRMEHMEKQSERLSHEAYTDPLTKVWNKRALNQRLSEALGQPAVWPLSLIVLDIDHFKDINDNYGHQAGDLALRSIAGQAQGTLRKKIDSLFRYAGDEFVVLLLSTPMDDAMVIGERMREKVMNLKFTNQGMNDHQVTISLGIAQASQGDTPASLFGRADAALLDAKHSGRNQIKTA